MMPDSTQKPLWTGRVFTPPTPPQNMRQIETLVVGGGIAGLSTALHLSRAGKEVAVMEAGTTLGLATRASAGIVTGQLVRNTPHSILKHMGPETGGRLLEAVAASPREIFSLIRDENLDCDAIQAGFLAPFFNSEEKWQAAVTDWARWRDDVDLIDAAETRRLSGCRDYLGAICDRSGGGINPAAYADELGRCVIKHGGTILFDTHVEKIEPLAHAGASRWRVWHSGGTTDARHVVLAANGGNALLHPALKQSLLPLPVLELATAPLPHDLREKILPAGHTLTDLSTDVFSIRYSPEGKLITAMPASGNAVDWPRLTASVNDRCTRAIPGWRHQEIENAWIGTAWLFSDCVPRMPLLAPGLLAIQACNGRGLAINTVAGADAARFVESEGRDLPRLPATLPRSISGFAIARHAPRLIMTAARVWGRLKKMC